MPRNDTEREKAVPDANIVRVRCELLTDAIQDQKLYIGLELSVIGDAYDYKSEYTGIEGLQLAAGTGTASASFSFEPFQTNSEVTVKGSGRVATVSASILKDKVSDIRQCWASIDLDYLSLHVS